MEQYVSLPIVFICLIFLIGIVEKLTLVIIDIFERTPYLPNKYGVISAYFLAFMVSWGISYLGDFRFFSFLLLDFKYILMDYAMSGLVIAGGTKFLLSKMSIINQLPAVISGLKTVFVPRLDKKIQESQNEIDDKYKKIDNTPTI